MKPTLKRVLSGAVAVTAALTAAPFISTPVAFAAGTLQGSATMTPATGTSASNFTLVLPPGAACGGDSANAGYRVQSYMVPASVDPSSLQFDSAGPTPQGLGASFRQALYDTTSSPYVNAQTADASPPGGPGPIINIPNFNFSVFSPGDIPAGAYNVGIACTLGPASATQMKEFWNTTVTFTTNASGGPAQVNYSVGAVPSAPVLNSLAADDSSLAASFTATPSTPATTQFTVTATPSAGGTSITATGTASPITVTGLTNGTQYDVTVRATNSVGDGPNSNILQGTPNPGARPAVQNLQATPGTGKVDLTWNAPTGPAPIDYLVEVNPPAVPSFHTTNTTASITGLTPGTLYTFTVTPTHPAPFVGTPASAQASPFDAQVMVGNVEVTRPVGAIVLTQVCGTHGAIPADTTGTAGFPSGSLPAIAAQATGTAPTLPGGAADPTFSQYPYPENPDGTPAPNYPTNCGIDLGTAKFVKAGNGGGQFFAASGVLNQVTIVDTRDTDTGWSVTGSMSAFSAGPGRQFSGSQLGWSPVMTADTAAFSDADGNAYDQMVTAGGVVNPNTPGGLGAGRTLASATANRGLGIAQLDARLKLLIPVMARSGEYVGTLTITTTGA